MLIWKNQSKNGYCNCICEYGAYIRECADASNVSEYEQPQAKRIGKEKKKN